MRNPRIQNQNQAAGKGKQKMFQSKMFRRKKQQTASPELACSGRSCQVLRKDSPCFAWTRWRELMVNTLKWRTQISVIAKLLCQGVVLLMSHERENATTCIFLIPNFLEKAWEITFPTQESYLATSIWSWEEWRSRHNSESGHLGISLAKFENSASFHPSIQPVSQPTTSQIQRAKQG